MVDAFVEALDLAPPGNSVQEPSQSLGPQTATTQPPKDHPDD
jgi:hypothetical protein